MRATAILRVAAVALIVAFGALPSAFANHRGGHGPSYHGPAPMMHGGYRHGLRPWADRGMHYRHGYGRHSHHRHHGYRHHGYGRHRHFAGRPAFLPRPYHRPLYRERRYRGLGYFPRPRLHRARLYGEFGYSYRPRYRALPAFARPAYYPYGRGVSHGYGYPIYPTSYGTIAGGSLYAPLYNRPAFTCY